MTDGLCNACADLLRLARLTVKNPRAYIFTALVLECRAHSAAPKEPR